MQKMYSNTNWNLYRSFIVLYETGKYTAAEKILLMERKNIRANIQTLENQLNDKLFNSHTQGVTPTTAATTLYKFVKSAIDTLVEGEASIKTIDENTRATIKLAMPSPMASVDTNKYFQDFCNRYKFVCFEFYKKDSIDLLLHKKIDFMIEAEYIFRPYTFETIDIVAEELVIIATKDFLAKNGLGNTITKEQFLNLPFIAHREFIKEFTVATGIEAKPFTIAHVTSLVHDFVTNNMGIGLYFKETLRKHDDDNLVEVKIDGVSLPRFKVVCAYNRGHLTNISKLFLEGLIASYKDGNKANPFCSIAL